MNDSSPNYLKIFNDHFMEFVQDIISVFPDNPDLIAAKNAFLLLRKSNPKMIISVFQKYVIGKYKQEVENGDIDYFLNKTYNNDLTRADNSEKIIEAIDRLRKPINSMSDTEKRKVISYIQNLQKLTELYYS